MKKSMTPLATGRKLVTVLLAGLAVGLTSAGPAAAQQSGPFRRAERPAGNAAAEPRQAVQRGAQPPARQASAPVQMSPEERRQLRRDIDEHGRDLYKERRERR